MTVQKKIKEAQIPSEDLRKVKLVAAVKAGAADGTCVPVWEANRMASFVGQNVEAKTDDWSDVLVEVDDPDDEETLNRLRNAVETRKLAQARG